MSIFDTITLEAFVRAVSQLKAPLSPDLKLAIQQASDALDKHQPEAADKIRNLVKKDAELKEQYTSVYTSLQKQYQAQERTKSLAFAANGSTSFDLESQIAQVLNADDIIASTQRFVQHLDNSIDAQAVAHSKQPDFWERGDRVVALASGGAFLGVLLAQIPGAVIGGLLAGIYAWFTAPQAKPDRNT